MIAIGTVKNYTKEFWKYASKVQGVSKIDDVFARWANKNSTITMDELKYVWANVNKDVIDAFGMNVKQAFNTEELDKLIKLVEMYKGNKPEEKDISELPINVPPMNTQPLENKSPEELANLGEKADEEIKKEVEPEKKPESGAKSLLVDAVGLQEEDITNT